MRFLIAFCIAFNLGFSYEILYFKSKEQKLNGQNCTYRKQFSDFEITMFFYAPKPCPSSLKYDPISGSFGER